MKVFITGVSGYVARVTLPYLFDDGEITEVCGMDVRAPKMEHPKLNFIQGDVRNGNMESAMKGAGVAVHMAFIVGEIKDKKKIYDINVNGTRQALESAGLWWPAASALMDPTPIGALSPKTRLWMGTRIHITHTPNTLLRRCSTSLRKRIRTWW